MLEVSWPLLLGPYALTVGLVIALIQLYRGKIINPDVVVRRADYDALKVEQTADRVLLHAIADAVAPEDPNPAPTLRRPRRR